MFATSLLGLLDPFPKKVGIDPVVQRKPRNRHTRLQARRNKACLRRSVIPPTPVSQNPPDNQLTFVTLNHLVSTSVRWTPHAARRSMTKGARKFALTLERRGGTVDDYAFPSRVDPADHLSTRQYARLVDEWVAAIGLRCEDYGTHSLRRTKAAMIYKATGNLRAIQILLGHTKIENTVRYLGVDIEDALELAEHTEI
ncbi:Phage integrase family protein [Ensifer adhaerens]|nr:Phage integrase family protein [Ensifer adhaerens]